MDIFILSITNTANKPPAREAYNPELFANALKVVSLSQFNTLFTALEITALHSVVDNVPKTANPMNLMLGSNMLP